MGGTECANLHALPCDERGSVTAPATRPLRRPICLSFDSDRRKTLAELAELWHGEPVKKISLVRPDERYAFYCLLRQHCSRSQFLA